MSKYAEPWAAGLSGLKQTIEEESRWTPRHRAAESAPGRPTPTEKVFEIYIKTTPERLWEAITDAELQAQVQLRRERQLRLDARLPL